MVVCGVASGKWEKKACWLTMLLLMPEDEYIYSYILFVFPRISIKMACPGGFEGFMLLFLARSVFFFPAPDKYKYLAPVSAWKKQSARIVVNRR